MKLKKILASLTAAALAVTTMAFAPVSVSAEDYDNTKPFIMVDGHTSGWAINWREAQNINVAGTHTYHFEVTTGYNDIYSSKDLTVYFYDAGKSALSDLEVVSFEINDEVLASNLESSGLKDDSSYDFIANANADGSRKSIPIVVDENVDIPANSTVSIDVKVTNTPVTVGNSGVWEKNSEGKWQIANTGSSTSLNQALEIDLSDYVSFDYSEIASIKVDLLVCGEFANGGLGITDANEDWQSANWSSATDTTAENLSPEMTLDGVVKN